jgi:hypothetical protein
MYPQYDNNKKKKTARHWWLILVILATQEAEISRIKVQSQPSQIVPRDPITKKNPSQKRAGRVAQGVGLEFKAQYCKKKDKNYYAE